MAQLRTSNRIPYDDDRDPRSSGSFQVPPGGPMPEAPPESPVDTSGNPQMPSRGGETPRERVPGSGQPQPPMGGPGGGPQATPLPPMAPTPVAGAPGPFPSMPDVPPISLAQTSKLRGLFGSEGGLKGGGLGLPFDPTSNNKSDPISTLLQLLQGGGGGY